MKRGRPKKDYSYLLNQEFNNLKIIKIRRNDQSGHPMCRTRCTICKKETTKRIYDVVNGFAKTCGCGSVRAFKRYIDNKVAELSISQIEQVWCTVQDSANTRAAAGVLKLNRYVVSFAARQHQKRLDGLSDTKKQAIWEAAQGRADLNEIAQQFGLSRRSAGYIVRKMHSPLIHPKMKDSEVISQLDALEAGLERVPKRDEQWFRSGEFDPKQLRRKRNGQVLGEYADLYRYLKNCPRSPRIDPTLANRIKKFLKSAEGTFSNRRLRQDRHLKRQREYKIRNRSRANTMVTRSDDRRASNK